MGINIGSLFVEVGMNSANLAKDAAKVDRIVDGTAEKLNKLGNNPSLDRLRAKYNPLFAVHVKYKKQLDDIRKAHQLGAISTDEMSAAIGRERRAALSSIAALKGRNNAMVQVGKSSNYAAYQQKNLLFQLNDVAVSLAGGQRPLTVFAQQGSQIAQIYGPSEGGVGRALKETGKLALNVVTKFPLLTAAVAAGALAVAGLTHEINQNSDVVVSMGDTALAVFQVIGSGIYDIVKPAVDAIAGWFSSAWDKVITATKSTINLLINSFQAGYESITSGWKLLPTVLDVAIRSAANNMIGYIENFVNKSIGLINGLIDKINTVAAKLPGASGTAIEKIESVSLGRVANPNAGNLAKLQAARVARTEEITSQDRAGQFFQAVKTQAIANAKSGEKVKNAAAGSSTRNTELDRLQSRAGQIFQETRTPQELFKQEMEELDSLVKKGMISWDTYERAVKRAQDRMNATLGTSKKLSDSIADSVTKNIQSAESWQDLGKVAINVIKDILTQQLTAKAQSLGSGAGKGLSGLFSGGGGGLFSSIGSGLSSLAGKVGGFFSGGFSAGVAHTGGIVGGAMASRSVHPSTFARAPRFHGGGIVGDEVPIIAKKGEGVFTKEQMRSMGGGVTVNMNISTPDAQSFMKSKGQIAAGMTMAIKKGQRNL